MSVGYDEFKEGVYPRELPSQHDISNLKIRSAKTLVRQMGHLEVDITFGMIHLW